jgi:hypothetical protein
MEKEKFNRHQPALDSLLLEFIQKMTMKIKERWYLLVFFSDKMFERSEILYHAKYELT